MSRATTMKALLAAALLSASLCARAFMPAGGLWVINSENTGQSGRGFQLEVENEVLVFTYYGYRADGSSVFYLAAGPIRNNTFSAAVTEYQGGRPLGAAYKPATALESVGTVTLSFTSGLHGSITLPGEVPMAISKFAFGYPSGPDGLLGTWLMTYLISGLKVTEVYALNTKLSTSTSTGNGIVTDPARSVACEFQISGDLRGTVLCTETGPLANLPDVFNFKFSGDHGTGIGGFYHADGSPSNAYEAHVSRITTGSGKNTGLNEGTNDSLLAMKAAVTPDTEEHIRAAKAAIPAPASPVAPMDVARRWAEELRLAIGGS
jgi:hypothetical protein